MQWDILFYKKTMISHIIDEAIRLTAASALTDKAALTLIESITTLWLRPFGVPKLLAPDRQTDLVGEEVSQWLDRCMTQLKIKDPGEHAQVVERHHEVLRQLLKRVEAQPATEFGGRE